MKVILQAAPSHVQVLSRHAEKITASFTVRLGPEDGRPLGTLFQLRRSGAHEVVGAVGVPQFFNHYVRSNPRMLHVHGRTANESAFTVQELGSPRSDNPRYHTFVLDGVLIDGTNRQFYNEATSTWTNLPTPWNGATFVAGEQINYAHRIDGKVFISTDKGVFYDGVRILSLTSNPSFKSGLGTILYHDGLLFTEYADGVLRTYSWSPGSALGAPISAFTLISGHFLRAFGVLGGVVYAVSGYGRLLRYERGANTWAYVTQPEAVSEFYSLMVVHGTLRLGDYPNGDQWVLNAAGTLERLPSYPPEEAGASGNAREIQAMTMYGGDQILPTWPWGVVHRQHMATATWYNQRMFTAPPISISEAPYLATFGNNDWGQRLCCTGLYRDGVFVCAAPKTGDLQAPNAASVPNLSEYGKVWLLKRPHAFSAELDWKSGETTFTYEISAAGISIKQDGVSLGAIAGFAPSQFEGSDPITLEVGNGIYGPFGSTLVRSEIAQEFSLA